MCIFCPQSSYLSRSISSIFLHTDIENLLLAEYTSHGKPAVKNGETWHFLRVRREYTCSSPLWLQTGRLGALDSSLSCRTACAACDSHAVYPVCQFAGMVSTKILPQLYAGGTLSALPIESLKRSAQGVFQLDPKGF